MSDFADWMANAELGYPTTGAGMRIEDITIGQAVREKLAGEVGTVDSIDYDEYDDKYLVWVRFPPVNGVPQLVDVDPGDLDTA